MLIRPRINIINTYALDSNTSVHTIVNKPFNVCNNFVDFYSEARAMKQVI